MQPPPPPQSQYPYPQQPGMAQQTTFQVPGPSVSAVYQQPAYRDVDSKACKTSGSIQINLGLLCIIFGIVSICIDCEFSYYGTAIWGGLWFMATGFLGASVPKTRGSNSHCQLVGYLVLGVFSAIYALDLIILTSVAIAEEGPIYRLNNNGYPVASTRAARVAIDSMLLIFGILELFVACWGVGVAAKNTCGTRTQTVVTMQPSVVQYTTTAAQGYYGNQGAYQYPQYGAQLPGPSMPQAGEMAAANPPPGYQEKPPMPPQ